MTTIRNAFGVPSHTSGSGFIAGLECEIENIHRNHSVNQNFWNIITDGSLRNNGWEYVSHPSNKETLLKEFKELHTSIVFQNQKKEDRFSSRTSIHVHVNCLDLEEQAVRTIVLWYALFEPIFFSMVTQERQNNIHCVPLNQTVLSENYRRPLKYFHSRWSKYTALNLLPLNKYGTLEFRHMHGHDDVALLGEWLSALENLFVWGQENSVIPPNIMSNGSIKKAFYAIFKDTPSVQHLLPVLDDVVSDNLLDVKLSLI